MQSATLGLLQSIKRIENISQLPLEFAILAILKQAVSLQEVRKFIHNKQTADTIEWTKMPEQQLQQLALDAQQFISDHRLMWASERQRYDANMKTYEERVKKTREKAGLSRSITKQQMLSRLKSLLEERKTLLQDEVREDKEILLAENEEIETFIFLLQNIIAYESAQTKYSSSNDPESLKIVASILQRLSPKPSIVPRQSEENICLNNMQELKKKQNVMLKRMQQIFSYYCKDNNSVGLTFEQYTKSSQTLDLKLFLKYFKDFSFHQANKYRFRTVAVTQLFKAEAINGLTLSFHQFWSLHKKMFDLLELENLPKGNAAKLREEINKLDEMNSIISEQKTKQHLINVKLKTEDAIEIQSPKLIKYSSVEARVYKSKSSKALPTDPSTPISSVQSSIPRFGTNFIHQVRQELMNQQNKSNRKKIERSKSLFGLSPQKQTKDVAVHLPKILKLSTEQISNRGIYDSLKHFAKHDFLAQQTRIKDIIGLSMGDDEKFISEYFRYQSSNKQEREKEMAMNKLIRRQKLLQSLTHKQDHCKKYDPAEVQPYMRF